MFFPEDVGPEWLCHLQMGLSKMGYRRAEPRLEHSDGHSFPSAQPRAGEIYHRVICRMHHATIRHEGANVVAAPVRDVTFKRGERGAAFI